MYISICHIVIDPRISQAQSGTQQAKGTQEVRAHPPHQHVMCSSP